MRVDGRVEFRLLGNEHSLRVTGWGELRDARGPKMARARSSHPFLLDGVEHRLVLAAPLDADELSVLTEAERLVVQAVLDGRSNAAIAKARGVSPRTVANQLACAFRKLGVTSRTELAARLILGDRAPRVARVPRVLRSPRPH